MIILNPLSDDETIELQHHLTVIKTSVISLIRSLAHIYQKRLYRGDGSRTWAEFCQQELNFSPRYGYYLVQAFTVLQTIEAHNQTADKPLPLPSNEAQARALSAIPNDAIVATWQATLARHGVSASRKTVLDVYHELVNAGAKEETAQILGQLANTKTGLAIAEDVLVSGYLQTSDDDDAIPLSDLRPVDVSRYHNTLRHELIMQRVAREGGVPVIIYPQNTVQTAKILGQLLTVDQLKELAVLLSHVGDTSTTA
jgi:hypothetical protein